MNRTSNSSEGKTAIDQSEVLIRASKWFPFGVLIGLVFCGVGALEIAAWWPVIYYLAPWSMYALLHYLNQERFLREAVWCMKIKITGQAFIFAYGPSLAVYAILLEWYGLFHGTVASLVYTALIYQYYAIYLKRTRSAWEEKKTSNYRFALDPDTKTFRFDEGFNFGRIPGMWWDNLVFGSLLGLTTFSGALIGDMAGDLGIGKPITLAAGTLMTLLASRLLIPRELVSLQKIREYEQQHGVTIRPQ